MIDSVFKAVVQGASPSHSVSKIEQLKPRLCLHAVNDV